MSGKRQHRGATRLSGRNVLETLNDILQMLNRGSPEAEQLRPVKTEEDLYVLRQKVKKCILTGKPIESRSRESVRKVEVMPHSVIQSLSIIATNAWRARNKMVSVEGNEQRDDMRRTYRHIEAIFEALSHIGIEIRDMTGRAYDTGMALKVITFEKTPGLTREQVVETIRPTVTFQGSLIQIGEVVVGTPETPQTGSTYE